MNYMEKTLECIDLDSEGFLDAVIQVEDVSWQLKTFPVQLLAAEL